MNAPFRALDEFDVFMVLSLRLPKDAVNRRLAVKLLIESARTSTNSTQFILISPQNTSHIKELSGPDINIMKLNAPERNQTTLNFSRQDEAE
jgi:hypothetical protein